MILLKLIEPLQSSVASKKLISLVQAWFHLELSFSLSLFMRCITDYWRIGLLVAILKAKMQQELFFFLTKHWDLNLWADGFQFPRPEFTAFNF